MDILRSHTRRFGALPSMTVVIFTYLIAYLFLLAMPLVVILFAPLLRMERIITNRQFSMREIRSYVLSITKMLTPTSSVVRFQTMAVLQK